MGMMRLLMLQLLLLVVEPTPPVSPAPIRSAHSLALLRARDECGKGLTPDQRHQLDKMQFEDAPHVRQYLHCFWSRLQLWLDETGFQAQRIIQSFGGERRLNVEQALPVINGCNAKTSSRGLGAQAAVDWCFRAFVCVMSTPVGEWYKRHMSDVINGNA
ncbi:uncharacterized protein LOC6549749 [Drosophila erecta]|uniref:Odorant-binding protein 8a n=1 Tax=Drosophila erecta TaxID=7220 RepID=B3NUF6_DROER|nr:uncharacterized protein LOC6549749 [Drosophila erecta]EDV46279.1 Odorant-binding protein 8a [Drosophila erecta]